MAYSGSPSTNMHMPDVSASLVSFLYDDVLNVTDDKTRLAIVTIPQGNLSNNANPGQPSYGNICLVIYKTPTAIGWINAVSSGLPPIISWSIYEYALSIGWPCPLSKTMTEINSDYLKQNTYFYVSLNYSGSARANIAGSITMRADIISVK